jgi:hypothetical protein
MMEINTAGMKTFTSAEYFFPQNVTFPMGSRVTTSRIHISILIPLLAERLDRTKNRSTKIMVWLIGNISKLYKLLLVHYRILIENDSIQCLTAYLDCFESHRLCR